MHATFNQAGMLGALRRLCSRVQLESSANDSGSLLEAKPSFLSSVPDWMHGPFSEAVVACTLTVGDPDAARELVREHLAIARTLAADHEATAATAATAATSTATDIDTASPYRLAAVARLVHGDMLEKVAAAMALKLCAIDQQPPAYCQSEFASLCHDAYLVATWTSAHAEYLAMTDEMDDQRKTPHFQATNKGGAPVPSTPLEAQHGPSPNNGHESSTGLLVTAPELHSVMAAANVPNLVALCDRADTPRMCSKSAAHMLALITRACNAGSRGWESTVDSTSEHSEGGVRVIMHMMSVCLTGLHSVLHPAMRQDWRSRLCTAARIRASANSTELKVLTKQCSIAVKEAIRLLLATQLAEDHATLQAAIYSKSPTAVLVVPPFAAPNPSMQAAQHAFCRAGRRFAEVGDETLADAITKCLLCDARMRGKKGCGSGHGGGRGGGEPPPLHHPTRTLRASSPESGAAEHGGDDDRGGGNCDFANAPLVYSMSWLGGRWSTASTGVCTAMNVVGSILTASFRGTFVPFWLHAAAHGHRVSRLDKAQYGALHRSSPGHHLCRLLPEEERLRLQRLALRVPNAPLMTVDEVCETLGIAPPPHEEQKAPDIVPCPNASRAYQEAERQVLALSPYDGARVIHFARIAALRNKLLVFALGETTARLQEAAIKKRLLVDPSTPMDALPQHARTLYLCSECKRVCNAVQTGRGKELSFNELGVSACMLRVTGDVRHGQMRCAKRSSAALRTALHLEQQASAVSVEECAVRCDSLPLDLRPTTIIDRMASRRSRESASDVAKLRRDIKSSNEQGPVALACGDVPLVTVPLLGRAIRAFGDFYGVCTMCGALTKLTPCNRYGGAICCLRCDFGMLYGPEEERKELDKRPKPPPLSCRFCGKAQTPVSTTWKVLKAPADSGGPNAHVPPPLRTVSYCPSHYRSWLSTAHMTMPTNLIFSHLLAKAKPIFTASQRVERPEEALTEDVVPPTAKVTKRNMRMLEKRMRTNSRKKKQRV